MSLLNMNVNRIHKEGNYLKIGSVFAEYVENVLKTQFKIYSPNNISVTNNDILIVRNKNVSDTTDVDIFDCTIYFNTDKIPMTNSPNYTLPYNECIMIYAKYYYHARERDLFILNSHKGNLVAMELYEQFNVNPEYLPTLYVIRTNKYHMSKECGIVLSQISDETTLELINQYF